jgi:hypothetical protein
MDTTATGMCFGACPHHAHTKVRNATHAANGGSDGHASFHKCRACADAYAVAVEERGGGGRRGQTARKHNTLPDPVVKRRRPNPRATQNPSPTQPQQHSKLWPHGS